MWTVARTYERAASPPDMDAWQDQLSGSEALVANASDSGITVTVHVQADSAQQAVLASSHVDEVVGQKPVGLEALTQDEHDRRARRTNLPELMSAADIAHHLGVTRQRVHQLRTTAQFPHPLAELRGGAVWDGAAIRAFARTRQRKPGRPTAAVPDIKVMHILVPREMTQSQVRGLIRAELNHQLRNSGVWAMRFQFREDPLPDSGDNELRRYEVVFGTAPGEIPADKTITDLTGIGPLASNAQTTPTPTTIHQPGGTPS